MFTFFGMLSISVNTLGVQLTPHVQNLKSPHPHTISLNLRQNTQNEFENEFEKVLIK